MGKDMVSDDLVEPMLPVRKIAQLLHMHANTVRRWSEQGIIMAYRINRRGDRRFRRQDIARLLSELNKNGGSPEVVVANERYAAQPCIFRKSKKTSDLGAGYIK